MRVLGAIVSEYKSIGEVEVPLTGLTVLLGPNGSGKTNLIEAIGFHDPVARAALRRSDEVVARRARIGLVIAFDVDASGRGADDETLRQMVIWPWKENLRPREITDGIGAYCGSAWWLYGGDLYDAASQETLADCYQVIRRSLLADVPPEAADDAARLVDLLLLEPVLIVQEDFMVELSCDRLSDSGRKIMDLAQQVRRLLARGALADLIGVLTSWTGRWPPLTAFTRGPGAGQPVTPAGFEWVASEFGGVRVVTGDPSVVEQFVDQAVEAVHDHLFHLPGDGDYPPDDMYCTQCLHPDHGGRVDPSVYAKDHEHERDDLFVYPGSADWLEQQADWFRPRPELLQALAAIEAEANQRLLPFVAAQGRVRLEIRPVPEWDAAPSRCRITFEEHQNPSARVVAGWDGAVGIAGHATAHRAGPSKVALADLGAGVRRWVATALRLAAEACAARSSSRAAQILLIDEPEQHLHPAAQSEVVAWCLEQARNHHAVLVATHSSAFLALPPQQVTTCQVTRIAGTTQVRPLPAVHGVDALDRARDLGFELGLGRDALAQLTRAVVVVEGEWDRRLLHHFYGAQLAQQRVLVVPLQGSNELGGMADAAVIPALGLPVVALLDEIRGSNREELERLQVPNKAERALIDLARALGDTLRFVRYDDPDVICALPETAVRRVFPTAAFPGWDALLEQWRAEHDGPDPASFVPFKKWALKAMGLPRAKQHPTTFFTDVLTGCQPSDQAHPRFHNAVDQLLAAVGGTPQSSLAVGQPVEDLFEEVLDLGGDGAAGIDRLEEIQPFT